MVGAKTLFKKECRFVLGASKVEHVPNTHIPEIAFVGRSNVGKSSLLNAITKRKSLARTSKTPGCTQQLNFFELGEQIMFVDLPGYGYAKASKKEVEGWGKLIHEYLRGRPPLRQVCLLIDGRHGLKPTDVEIMQLLDEEAVSYQIVLTKSDKQSAAGLEKIINGFAEMAPNHPALHPEVLVSSSRDGEGLDVLRNRLAQFVN